LIAAARSARNSDEARARACAVLTIHRVRQLAPEGVQWLDDDAISLGTRQRLAVGMGRCRASQAVKTLLELLEHPEPAMQEAAVVALGRIGTSSAYHPILSHWDDRQGALRPLILVALQRLGAVDGAERLLGAVRTDSEISVLTAAFVRQDKEIDGQLPRHWLAEQLGSPIAEARRDAALLLSVFGDSRDAHPLRNLATSETDPIVKKIAERGSERLVRRGRTEPTRFDPWPE